MITAIKRQLTLEEFQKCERIKEIIKRKGVWQWCLTMKKNVVIIESLNPFQSITKQNINRLDEIFPNTNEPFSNLNIILFGDLFQVIFNFKLLICITN